MNWAAARRAWFEVYADRVECGDWAIPLAEVTEAVAYRTRGLILPGTVLQLKTADQCYQFGFNPWASPLKHMGIAFREERVRLGMSPGSMVARLLLLAAIIYYAVRYF